MIGQEFIEKLKTDIEEGSENEEAYITEVN
jgi:hypothetical protein